MGKKVSSVKERIDTKEERDIINFMEKRQKRDFCKVEKNSE